MTHLSRRHLCTGLSLAVLAGCANAPSTSQLAQDAKLIAAGLSGVTAALASVPGVPPAALAQVNSYLVLVQADADTIAQATAGAPPVATVQDIAALVGRVAAAVLPLVPGGGPLVAVVQAAEALVPVILAAAGVASATPGQIAYTPAQARAILAAGVR